MAIICCAVPLLVCMETCTLLSVESVCNLKTSLAGLRARTRTPVPARSLYPHEK